MGNRNNKQSLLPARKQPLFRQLEASVGREDITACLVATDNPRASRLLDMMLDPAYAGLSFGQLCSRAGLSGGEVTRLICQRQLAEGMIRMSLHLPDIMENVALAARGRSQPCWKCQGVGVADNARCADCHGAGEVRIPGDISAVRMVLTIAGVLASRN